MAAHPECTGVGHYTSAVMTRPAADADGRLTVTWHQSKHGPSTCFGWAVPDLDPNVDKAFRTHGSFVGAYFGELFGLGIHVIRWLPSHAIRDDTLSLRYDPVAGTMHARVNDGPDVLCFTDLRDDLVPAVCFCSGEEGSCIVVVFDYFP